MGGVRRRGLRRGRSGGSGSPFNTRAARVDAVVHAPAAFRRRGVYVFGAGVERRVSLNDPLLDCAAIEDAFRRLGDRLSHLEDVHLVQRYRRVAGGEGQPFGDCLCHQDAVEGIAVMRWQAAGGDGVGVGHREFPEAQCLLPALRGQGVRRVSRCSV